LQLASWSPVFKSITLRGARFNLEFSEDGQVCIPADTASEVEMDEYFDSSWSLRVIDGELRIPTFRVVVSRIAIDVEAKDRANIRFTLTGIDNYSGEWEVGGQATEEKGSATLKATWSDISHFNVFARAKKVPYQFKRGKLSWQAEATFTKDDWQARHLVSLAKFKIDKIRKRFSLRELGKFNNVNIFEVIKDRRGVIKLAVKARGKAKDDIMAANRRAFERAIRASIDRRLKNISNSFLFWKRQS